MMVIRVSDTGVGIAAADIGTLFTKFNRIPNELSASVPGSGLGLYWVRKIIELHGGNITVESPSQKGTAFTITMSTEG
jgi:signal transduction histidine kinase